MNPRLGFAVLLSCTLASLAIACSRYGGAVTPTPLASPASPSPAPDTLYVQDATSRTVRAYKNASNLNAPTPAIAFETLPTNDNANPDVVYSPTFNVLWYPNQSTGAIDVWFAASTKNGKAPDATVALANQEGAAVYDSNHDLLVVAQNTTNTVQVFASAHTLGMGSNTSPAGAVTLNMTDGFLTSTPRPQEMYYDATHNRLFVSDNGSVVAAFDSFGTVANTAATTHTTQVVSANRELLGLFSPDGLAYNASADVLFIAEEAGKQINVVHSASTASGPTGHTQLITGFQTGPTGLAEDAIRDILFAYDPIQIWVIPNATTAAGAVNNIPNRRVIFDSLVALSGFGITVDTTH